MEDAGVAWGVERGEWREVGMSMPKPVPLNEGASQPELLGPASARVTTGAGRRVRREVVER